MKRCKCKYRVRWFYSKGALLVLAWTLSVSMVTWTLYKEMSIQISQQYMESNSHYRFTVIAPMAGVLAAPVFGWLADAKLGNYRVLKTGLVLIFVATVFNSVCLLTASVVTTKSVFMQVAIPINSVVFVVGFCAYIVTSLQLGLDQMPDASTSSITSFITCYVATVAIGYYLSDIVFNVLLFCVVESLHLNYAQIWSVFLVLGMSVALISDFFLTRKWLIIERKSPQSLKTIYQVLKFAAKHKAPVYRSALTYWEEDIPSRIDLGKSKYGGPFTTEQVEDVKTTLRLLMVSLSLCVITTAGFFNPNIPYIYVPNATATSAGATESCDLGVIRLFTYNSLWCSIILTLVHEFIIYPLGQYKLPTILKRIGIVSLVGTATSLLCLILRVVEYIQQEVAEIEWTIVVVYFVVHGFLIQVTVTSTMEFICAQSPYNIRGLLLGCGTIIAVASACLGAGTSSILFTSELSDIIAISVKTILCMVGFIIHCIVARWYKLRVRDENYSPQRVVEEVYDRYLTQRSRSYTSSTETIDQENTLSSINNIM